MEKKRYSLAIHGGAGTILQREMSADKEKRYREALAASLRAGEEVLAADGRALDAVEAAVRVMEDSPLFNAGRGAVYTHDETHEMDASIMDGKSLAAGAVGLICGPRNPISVARAVLEQSEHVFLCGPGAEVFARRCDLPFEDAAYFGDSYRREQWVKARREGVVQLDHSDEKKYGTVGAVARDRFGDLAAATSTGGVTNKRYGRIGDSPLIGAGTYANNQTCAVSCTGYGEDFIRNVVAYDLSCLIEYRAMPLAEAAEFLIGKKLKDRGGDGGLIAVGADGAVVMPFNSEGMYRAAIQEGTAQQIAIFGC